MQDMPRPRPPHLQRQVTRHGKVTWYVRMDRGPRTRIRGEFGSPEFDAAYRAAIAGTTPAATGSPDAGSLAWLLARYRESNAWMTLSAATRRQRENIFLHVVETAGAKSFAKVERASIAAGRDRRSGTPAQARRISSTPCAVCSDGH